MAFYQIDEKGKTIPKRARSRKPAEKLVRGERLYHYMIYVSLPLPDKKYRYIRKRFWLPSDEAAMAKERELKREEPVDALTWHDAFNRWKVSPRKKRLSAGHLAAVESTVNMWVKAFGANSTIEGTSLPVFVEWVTDQAKGTAGRGAQLHHSHLLTIAKWCRSRGFIKIIPFEHAPKPEAALNKVRAATIREFVEIAELLPPQMFWMWWLMGLTGMRISAACDLLETDIGSSILTVTTKGDKRVEYPITPEIQQVIDGARAWKAGKGLTSPTLFCSHRGRTWKHYTFSEQLRKRAPNHKITPHQLRHMAGTIMAEGNLSPDIIQAGLAHEDRSSAEDYIDKMQPMRVMALAAVSNAFKKVQIESKSDAVQAILGKSGQDRGEAKKSQKKAVNCPCCSRNFAIIIELVDGEFVIKEVAET